MQLRATRRAARQRHVSSNYDQLDSHVDTYAGASNPAHSIGFEWKAAYVFGRAKHNIDLPLRPSGTAQPAPLSSMVIDAYGLKDGWGAL